MIDVVSTGESFVVVGLDGSDDIDTYPSLDKGKTWEQVPEKYDAGNPWFGTERVVLADLDGDGRYEGLALDLDDREGQNVIRSEKGYEFYSQPRLNSGFARSSPADQTANTEGPRVISGAFCMPRIAGSADERQPVGDQRGDASGDL